MYSLTSLNFLSSLDDGVVTYVNSFAHRSWTLDFLVNTFAKTNFLKGGLVMTVYWWAWFRKSKMPADPQEATSRDTLLYTSLICIPAVLLARLMADFLPFRTRPILTPELHLKTAFAFSPEGFLDWSSFPSDHAVLFYALATGFYFVSRRMGWLMYFYVTIFISLPRLYLGVHYPSDILVGALLGIAAATTVQNVKLREAVNHWPCRLLEYSPGLFYAALFQLTYQTASLYEPTRLLGHHAIGLLHRLAEKI